MVYFSTATKHRSRDASWSIIAPPFITPSSGGKNKGDRRRKEFPFAKGNETKRLNLQRRQSLSSRKEFPFEKGIETYCRKRGGSYGGTGRKEFPFAKGIETNQPSEEDNCGKKM